VSLVVVCLNQGVHPNLSVSFPSLQPNKSSSGIGRRLAMVIVPLARKPPWFWTQG